MLRYILRRLWSLLLVWAVTVTVTFFAMRMVPGDPITVMLSDQSGNADLAERLRAQYGLDRPLLYQLFDYLAGIASGTFGLSYRFVGYSVINVIAGGLAITPILALVSFLVALPIGVVLGVSAAVRAGGWLDAVITIALVASISIPSFALAAVLVWVFSIKLELLPVAGWGSVEQAILPIIVLVVAPTAVIARLARTYMLEVLDCDYVRTARAKGVRESLVIYRHAMRNTLVPLLTSVGIIFGALLSGAFIVETVFNIPGLGRIAVESILARDYPVTMTIVLLFTAFYTLINFAVDLLYGIVDPRVRLTGDAS
ncbi:ABC transporter permease [Chelatococcus asaccharovorans]|uniref:ABC transporter permease n=1 Tax=Chelatococcus asaccharovorans TaxID=28210 RepID=UPI00224C6B72|nr:ABC transporter permease [Chelatococcus asaccharovorans]CAH1657665.1 Oligopeptide transport system permease protein OppB [Chelatococcus asaccharovorans]CAH1687548.1 Oligopeptide transport system permease protein OppB [Chelatococcus asaccharovorans]